MPIAFSVGVFIVPVVWRSFWSRLHVTQDVRVKLCFTEATEARDKAKALFKALPAGDDRDQALAALSRLGGPSLRKKILHRVSIIEPVLGGWVPDLRLVVGMAVKIRNYFVHGELEGLDFDDIDPLVPFLTDTLEFIFAASDLVEAGWDARQYSDTQHIHGHSFSRLRSHYIAELAELKRVLAQGASEARD